MQEGMLYMRNEDLASTLGWQSNAAWSCCFPGLSIAQPWPKVSLPCSASPSVVFMQPAIFVMMALRSGFYQHSQALPRPVFQPAYVVYPQYAPDCD